MYQRDAANTASDRPFVVVGYVRSVWGLDGEVRVEVASDYPQRFAPGNLVYVRGVPFRIRTARTVRNDLLLKFFGLDTRDSAQSLRGCSLEVPQEVVAPLPQGQYYHFQVLEMEVWTTDGECLGHVARILETADYDIYVVEKDGKEMLVPAVAKMVKEMDVDKRVMVVDLPPELR